MNLKLKRTPGIYLVGFMGCGKTTIGQKLAEEVGWNFFDLDDDIEKRANMTISRIFDEQGEAAFRRLEQEALCARISQISRSVPTVLALGGGAFAQPANAALCNEHGVSIWIDCPFDRIVRRVAAFTHRPLARDPETFQKLYVARREAYAKAHHRIEVDSDDAPDAVRRILALPGLFP